MLYAAGVPNREMMKTAPQVGYVFSIKMRTRTKIDIFSIATVWWEGNPCK